MLYKELRRTRLKFAFILITYLTVGLLFSTLLGPSMTFSNDSIFHRWVKGIFFITMGAAILSGSDSIAEETGKNTFSFLLTRPVSRVNVYAVKCLVNAITLSVILIVTSTAMFLIEQLPQVYTFETVPQIDGVANPQHFYWQAIKMPGGEAFTDITSILGSGLVVLALTTFVSIYSHSALQTIIITILIILGLLSLFAATDGFLFRLTYGMAPVFLSDLFSKLGFGIFLLLVTLAVGIFAAGLKIFKAKEF